MTLPTNVDANATTRTQTFIQKMNTIQNQGRKVLLSLGGAVNSGGVINVGTTTKRDNFITSVTNLLKTYPFDGLDIDIESGDAINYNSTLIFNHAGTVATPNSPTIDNLIYALKEIMRNYRGFRGKKMLLTFAPERHMITGGFSDYAFNNIESSASYLPMIEALKDSLDLVHTQLYGYGSDIGKNGNEYCVGTEGNALAVTEDLLLGYTLNHGQGIFSGLPANKIALGLASPCEGASAGFLTIAKIQSVVNYFRGTGVQPPTSTPSNCSWMTSGQQPYTKLSSENVNFGGLMTWSINYDVNVACSNNSFANNYLSLYGAFTTSTNAKNILTFTIPSQVGSSVINSTTNTISVTMPAGTNLASLVPTFTLSPNCNTAKLSGTAQNFTNPIQYTINHSDYSSKTWTVIVNLATGCTTPATPTSASASPATIASGQTSYLSASGCALGNTYQWSNGLVVSTNASFTTPALSMPTTYTVYCVNGACLSSGINVTVNICTTPFNPTSASASPTSINAGQTSTLTSSGCDAGLTYVWYDGLSPVSFSAVFTTSALSSSKIYTVHCVNGTCKSLGINVSVTINSECPQTIEISSTIYPTYTTNQIVQAAQNITTSSPPNIIINETNSNKLTYQAGNSITLSPGFSVQSGAVFSAKILGCSSTPPYSYQKITYQYGTDPNNIPLIVDVYQPSVATSASRKPLIIFTHGTGGNESNPHGTGDHSLAKFLAQNDGFVAAYFNFFGSDNTRLQTDGTHLPTNYNDVINYLKTNAATYGINTNAIILHGVSGSAAAASSVALARGDIFGCITEAGGRNIGLETYEPATIINTVSVAGVQSQSDGGFGEYRYNAADVRSGAAHNYGLYTENTAYAVVASPGQQGYCSAYNDCSLSEGMSYYTTKYGVAKITQYPLIVTGQSHGADATTQVAWDNFMKTKPKIMLNDRGITW